MNRSNYLLEIRKNLRSGGISVGSWMQIPHASIAEIMGQSGYDWVAIDMEHGSICTSQLPDLFRALELGGTLPLVRLATGSAEECKRALDAGAGGVIAPMIETASQLIGIRDGCRWPPAGNRGVGFSRANLFGRNFENYQFEAQAPLLVAMIENKRAIINLDEILRVDGLDAVLIGPYDLSASMGSAGNFSKDEFVDALAEIHNKCANHSVACGIHIVLPSFEDFNCKIKEGYRFIAFSIDAIFLHKNCLSPKKYDDLITG